jgi:hypothetical protein
LSLNEIHHTYHKILPKKAQNNTFPSEQAIQYQKLGRKRRRIRMKKKRKRRILLHILCTEHSDSIGTESQI